MRRAFILPIAALTLTPASALSAQAEVSEPAQQAQDVYFDVVVAMQEHVDHDAVLENTLAVARSQYLTLPDFIEAERQSPGFVDDVINEMRPVMVGLMDRGQEYYRREVAALFRANFSEDEAAELARLFRTPAVSNLMQTVSRAYAPEAQLSDIASTDEVTTDEVLSDVEAAADGAIENFSPQQRAEIVATLQDSEVWAKYSSLRQNMLTIRANFENAELSPEDSAAIESAVNRAAERHFGS